MCHWPGCVAHHRHLKQSASVSTSQPNTAPQQSEAATLLQQLVKRGGNFVLVGEQSRTAITSRNGKINTRASEATSKMVFCEGTRGSRSASLCPCSCKGHMINESRSSLRVWSHACSRSSALLVRLHRPVKGLLRCPPTLGQKARQTS